MATVPEGLAEKWDASFAGLQNWVARTGRLPSRRASDDDEYRLANWLNRQRTDARKDKLASSRESLLRGIPGALEPRTRNLSNLEMASRLAAFHAQNGRLPRHKVKEENTTADYLTRLRATHRDGNMSADALAVFEAVPDAVQDVPARQVLSVDERLGQLRQYLSTHGHLPSSKSGGVHRWLWRALQGEASVDPAEAKRARDEAGKLISGYRPREVVGPIGRPREMTGLYITAVEDYVGEHGHLPSSSVASALRFQRSRLEHLLTSTATSEVDAARIRALLAAPSWNQRGATGVSG